MCGSRRWTAGKASPTRSAWWTPEAQLAKGLDKLETILQHTQGLNPTDFDYRFNLTYGQAYTAAHPILAAIRARLDEATEARARDTDGAAR